VRGLPQADLLQVQAMQGRQLLVSVIPTRPALIFRFKFMPIMQTGGVK
jgi:hypothetical protein